MASPLAYTDHFYIETWTEEKGKFIYRKWVQYIDASRVGVISLLNEVEVQEDIEFKTGTKVTVPVESSDRARVVEAINLYLHYTKVKFTLEGFPFTRLNHWYDYIGDHWGLTIRESQHIVLVGGIPYTVNISAFYTYINNSDLSYLLTGDDRHGLFKYFNVFLNNIRECSVLLEVNIGEVDLSASREDMQYTDKTCRALYSKYFEMYKGFSLILTMDLVKNPSFGEACRIYSNYAYCFTKRDGLLNHIKWAKEDRPFSSSQELSASRHYFSSYYLDKQYSRSNHTEDRIVLKKLDRHYIDMRNKYKFVCVEEDSKNVSKYIKFYMQRLKDSNSWTFIGVTPKEQGELFNWVKDSYEFLDLEELEAFYKENYVSTSNATGTRIQKQLCRTYQYRGKVERDKAEDIGKLFLEATADKYPEDPQYYIVSEEYVNALSELGLCFNRYDYEEIAGYLNTYLKNKGIAQNDVYYSKKRYTYYSKGNWINLLELIKEDVELHKANEDKFFKAYFVRSFIKAKYPWMLNSKLINHVSNKGKFYSIIQSFANASDYLAKNYVMENLFLFTNNMYRQLHSKATIRYMSFSLGDLESMELLNLEFAKSFMIDILDFMDEYPLLKDVPHFTESKNKDIAEYINLVEKSKGDYTAIKNALEKEEVPTFASVLQYLHKPTQEFEVV